MFNFEENKELEGIYTSKEENQGQKNNSTIHHLEVGGKDVTFWGSTVLDGKLLSVEKHEGFGAKVKITFNGRVKGKGVQPYKDFDVEVWEGEDSLTRGDIKDKDIPIINEDTPVGDDEDEKVDLSKIPF